MRVGEIEAGSHFADEPTGPGRQECRHEPTPIMTQKASDDRGQPDRSPYQWMAIRACLPCCREEEGRQGTGGPGLRTRSPDDLPLGYLTLCNPKFQVLGYYLLDHYPNDPSCFYLKWNITILTIKISNHSVNKIRVLQTESDQLICLKMCSSDME